MLLPYMLSAPYIFKLLLNAITTNVIADEIKKFDMPYRIIFLMIGKLYFKLENFIFIDLNFGR